MSVTLIQNLLMHLQIKVSSSLESISFEKQHIGLFLASMLGVIILIILTTLLIKIFKNMSPKKRKILNILMITGLIVCNIALSVWWINTTFARPSYDQLIVLRDSYNMYKHEPNTDIDNIYLGRYPQQIPLMYYQSLVMKLFNVNTYENAVKLFFSLNVIYYIGIFILIYMIFKHIVDKRNEKKTKKEKYGYTSLITAVLFLNIPLIILLVNVYGDIPGIFYSFLATLMLIKGLEKKKIIYILLAIASITMAVLVRKNSLIILIALVIMYLLNIIKNMGSTYDIFKVKEVKIGIKDLVKIDNFKKIIASEKLKEIAIIGLIIPLFFVPLISHKAIANHYLKSRNINSEMVEQVPAKVFFAIGISNSPRAEGWFNDVGSKAMTDTKVDNEYFDKVIKERIEYFINNKKEFLKFYFKKTASMWAEPTYNAIFYATIDENRHNEMDKNDLWTAYFKLLRENKVTSSLYDGEYNKYMNLNSRIIQFTALIFSFGYIIYKIKNREKLTNAEMVLVLIFLGGYAFHILWEAKSRYIIGYHLALFPLAFMGLTIFSNYILEFIEKRKCIKNRIK